MYNQDNIISRNYLESTVKLCHYYKGVADRAMSQLTDEQLFWLPNEESNSIATVIKHLSGNMISRWTDFRHSDGEKPDRNREAEFENTELSREELMGIWESGWSHFLGALQSIQPVELLDIIYIRNEPHTIMEALNRQLAHYPYHVGQIVFIAKALASEWKAITIPKGGTKAFNQEKFGKESK